jgi:hypothetical protein
VLLDSPHSTSTTCKKIKRELVINAKDDADSKKTIHFGTQKLDEIIAKEVKHNPAIAAG